MSHAGHAYGEESPEGCEAVGEREGYLLNMTKEALINAGLAGEFLEVSVGSTMTDLCRSRRGFEGVRL